jgi:uncharacterized protein (TIGR02300 family)
MPAKDLGTKHVCWKCGTKFYDLKKADPVCPKCGADPRAAPVVKSPAAAEKRARAKAAAPVDELPEAPELPEEVEPDEELDEPVEDVEEADEG